MTQTEIAQSVTEFYKEGDLLFMKWDGQIIEALSYKGKNEFSGGVNNTTTAKFEITPDQKVKVAQPMTVFPTLQSETMFSEKSVLKGWHQQ